MPLFNCPECQREISSEAEACPGCGHPNKLKANQDLSSSAPKCYSCNAPATTRCQRCGTFSCPVHLESIWVFGNHGGHELRCRSCVDSANTGATVWALVIIILVISMIMLIAIGSVPGRFEPPLDPPPKWEILGEEIQKELDKWMPLPEMPPPEKKE